MLTDSAEADAFTRECTGHESRLAFPDHTFGIMSQSGDGTDFFRSRLDTAPQTGFSQACRNSAKCGCSLPARK